MTTKRGTAAEVLEQLQKEADETKAKRRTENEKTLSDLFVRQARKEEVDRKVNEILKKRSEREITGEIDLMLLRLRDLYVERRGAILQDLGMDGDFVWCVACGMEVVNLKTDPGVTCHECKVGSRT